jgi:hypothetical protein
MHCNYPVSVHALLCSTPPTCTLHLAFPFLGGTTREVGWKPLVGRLLHNYIIIIPSWMHPHPHTTTVVCLLPPCSPCTTVDRSTPRPGAHVHPLHRCVRPPGLWSGQQHRPPHAEHQRQCGYRQRPGLLPVGESDRKGGSELEGGHGCAAACRVPDCCLLVTAGFIGCGGEAGKVGGGGSAEHHSSCQPSTSTGVVHDQLENTPYLASHTRHPDTPHL